MAPINNRYRLLCFILFLAALAVMAPGFGISGPPASDETGAGFEDKAGMLPTWRVLSFKVNADNAPGPQENYGARAETIIYDVPYVPSMPDNEKLMLDVYSNPHPGLWPTVVMIHGGGWNSCDKSIVPKVYLSKVLAANGYVVFNINYRLLPDTAIKNQVEDAMAAVIWVKQHAQEYGADPERIAVAGGSAGGLIAALVAWASDDPFFTPTGYDGPLDSDVKVAALYYPVIDYDWFARYTAGTLLAPLYRRSYQMPANRKAYRELIKHLSPHNHIDAACVPTIMLTGDHDVYGLYEQSVTYVNQLKSLGVDAELYTVPGKDHAFPWHYWEPESLESGMRMVEFFDRYLKQ